MAQVKARLELMAFIGMRSMAILNICQYIYESLSSSHYLRDGVLVERESRALEARSPQLTAHRDGFQRQPQNKQKREPAQKRATTRADKQKMRANGKQQASKKQAKRNKSRLTF